MDEASGKPSHRQRFSFSAKPPILTLGLAAAATLFGAIVLVFWGIRNAGWFLLLVGLGCVAGGAGMAAFALLRAARSRTVVLLDAAGVTVIRGKRRSVVPWASVHSVVLNGARLTLRTDGGSSRSIVNPDARSNVVLVSLATAIRDRLASRAGSDEV